MEFSFKGVADSLHDDRIAGYGLLEKSQTEEPEVVVGPNDTDAWAVLIDPSGNIMQVPEAGESKPADEGVSTYNLRRMSAAYQIAPRADTPLDLKPYINAVTMYDSKGNVIPSGSTVTEGQMIEFKIEYTVTGQQLGVMNGETVTVNSNTLTYSLPSILEVVASNSGNIVNSFGQVVGTYDINGDEGTITMTFKNAYVEQNAKGIQVQGNISFFSTVQKISDSDGEHQDYEFTDEITLGVVIEEKEEIVGDLTIEKSKVSDDGEEIVYEIKVTSKEGTNGPITITDQMSTGLTFKQGIGVKKGNTDVPNVQFNAADDKQSFKMTLPQMAAGDVYTVTYSCKANIDLLDADMTVQNTAKVTGKDSSDKDLEHEVTVDHKFKLLEKTGELSEDGTKVTWTITVNQAKADISGWILEDRMGVGQNKTEFKGPVDIKGSKGEVRWSNQTLPFTFPEGSTDTYTIVYTTDNGAEYGERFVNAVTLKDHDTEVDVESGVGVPGNPFTKTGEAGTVIQDENGQYLLPITWTVTIDTTDGPIPGGQFLIDYLYGNPSDDMFMTYEQVMAACANIDAAVQKETGQDLEGFSAYEFVPGCYNYGDAYGYTDLTSNDAYKTIHSAGSGKCGNYVQA